MYIIPKIKFRLLTAFFIVGWVAFYRFQDLYCGSIRLKVFSIA